MRKLTQMFLGNGYQEEVIQRNIRTVMNSWKEGAYERKARGTEEKRQICLPSCEMARKLRPIFEKWNIGTIQLADAT
ncbi:unnamed protein product [Protopolystoma xenopodis]|uniref:Uncharacterized protein n=1 Tax=Protopolystoma xenopodis TaxID=117903 RepID=A0A3S5FE33_9PLAT|nr:unnamed protein product [Protopolystoma xenopodis]